ncbi:hypothetical protein POTOM_019531 [Populus tomentosa]|uniref:Uncharacterized protein n=1 Tax=Populus tomentosa TaxID=118781 RepID=A0A8X8A1D3_POPTO|nr:hypothetical protein POTOM_019531 [Populus tomentosa]
MEAALSDEQRRLLQEPGELGSLAGSSNMPELNQVISHQDLAPSTLVDVPDSTRQGSPSFNSISMQDDQSPKGGDHQPQIFDGNIDLSFLENEEGNVTGEISDSSVAEAPNSQLLDFEPSSFGIPLMEGHLEPESSDEPYLNRANSGQSIVQSAYSTFDPLHGNSKNAEQTTSSSVTPPLPILTQMEMIPTNEMVQLFLMGNGTPNQFNSQSQEDTFQPELFLPPLVLPFNQGSISFNDQVGQNNVIYNSIQQTTQFPASYPQNMVTTHAHSNLLQRPLASIRITTTMGNLEGTPSWINQYYELFPNHNTPPGPLTPSRYQPNQLIAANFFDSQRTNPMLPGPSMRSRRQHLTYDQLRLSDQVPGMLSGPQPPMNQRPQQRPYLFNQVQITPNVYDPQGSTMLPDSCLTLRSPQFPSRNLQVSGEHDVLNSQCYNSMFFGPTESSRHPNSFIHQLHPGHVYMNPNAATTQHGGFNQSGPSSLAPWVQFFSSQVQVNQAAVMPNIDNMQQENFVPWNFGNSTRSQMDSFHFQGLLNQAARPNASNLGLDTSLNSQIMGLDHNRQGKSTEVFSHHPDMVSMLSNHSENMILGSHGRGNSHFIIGESSSSKRQRTEWTPSHKVQESMNASSLGPRVDKNAIYDPRFEGIGLQIDPHLRMLALI